MYYFEYTKKVITQDEKSKKAQVIHKEDENMTGRQKP